MAGFIIIVWLLNIDFHTCTKETFPTGEVVWDEFWISSGWQGSSSCNKLYYQENSSAPREDLSIGTIYDSKLPVNQTKLIKYKAFLLLLVINQHIFQHSLSKGKSYWGQITWQADEGATAYLTSFLRPNDSIYATMLRPNYDYRFDHVNFDQGLLFTKRESPNNQFPLFLVYSVAASAFPTGEAPGSVDYGWGFDLEQTRVANGIKPPESSSMVADVSVRRLPDGSGQIFGTTRSFQPEGKELYGQTLSTSSTQWTRLDFAPDPLQGETQTTSRHDEFLFGYSDQNSHSYILCWRGTDFLGTKYTPVKLDEWNSSQGPFEEEAIFFRLRKQP